MWLDRLSGHSSPSNASPPQSRSFSPLPRRPGHLGPQSGSQRPPFVPRSSSLSSITNDSTTSLLGGGRKPNGSGLKQSTVVTSYPRPVEVLEKLLGTNADGSKDGGVQNGEEAEEADLFEELDFRGMSLSELVKLDNANDDDVHLYKPQAVDEYEKDKAKFEDLHRTIRACDDVLRSIELNLTSFQNDLGAVSAEIETLQARSTALNIRLENRKKVEKGLGPIVEEITIAPSVVKKISEGVIDESWVKALAEVEKRSKSLDVKAQEHSHIKGVNDLRPLLEHLINKALERIRDFLVAQIKALRSPNINAQIIQQQHFIRYKDLYAFLSRHHEKLAEEITLAYMNTMRWYFLNQFTRYEKALEKVKVHVIDKHDLMGENDGSKGSIASNSKAAGPQHDAFNLGRRIDLLKSSNQTAIPSYLAEEDKTTHYLEYSFRNFNLALIDNASAEYSFLTNFFNPSLSLSTISKHFNYIFEPTFVLGQNLTKTLISETVDSLGLLLCVRLNQHFAFELQRRKVPAVDGYINGTSMLLWPRFQVIMDQHCESIRKAASSLSGHPPTSKAEQSKQSAAPHFLTQRFGQFMESILALSTEAGDDEPVSTSLGRLRNEMEALLTKLAKGIGEARKRQRFLYNNYSLILTIIGDLDGKLAAEQRQHFEELKSAFRDDS